MVVTEIKTPPIATNAVRSYKESGLEEEKTMPAKRMSTC